MGMEPSAILRDWSSEWGQIKQGYKGQINQYGKFRKKDPVARSMYANALEYGNAGDSPLLTSLTDWAQDEVENRGRLTPQLLRENTQGSRAWAGMGGTGFTNQAFANELLNRDKYVEDRKAQAQRFGIGVEQLGEGAAESRQNVLSGALTSGTQAFSRLTNPILAYMGDLFNTNVNAQNAAEIASSNKNAALLGSGIESVGNVIGGAMGGGMSDERLKAGIRDTGEKTVEGIPIKRWHYRGDKQEYEGPMAQDVEKVVPSAVITTITGHKMVDFSQLSDPPKRIKRVRGRVVKSPLLMGV